MKVLVTGATGFLGSRIVKHFAGEPTYTHLLATGRKFSENNKVESSKVNYLLGDLSDQAFVQSLFQHEPDVVINCASLCSPWGKFEDFYQSNVLTQTYLIEESRRSSVERFIYISTPSIYCDYQDKMGISERSPVPEKMVNHYATTKWMAERLLEDSGLRYIILRPRALIGRGDTVIMPRLIRSYREGKLKIIGSGENMVDLTPVSNMVDAVSLAVSTAEENYNQAYNISNGQPVKIWGAINQMLKMLDYPPITKKLPYPLLYGLAYLMEVRARWLQSEREPTLTRYSVGTLGKSFTLDISKAKTKLNYQPRQRIEEAMVEFAEWYKNKEYVNA